MIPHVSARRRPLPYFQRKGSEGPANNYNNRKRDRDREPEKKITYLEKLEYVQQHDSGTDYEGRPIAGLAQQAIRAIQMRLSKAVDTEEEDEAEVQYVFDPHGHLVIADEDRWWLE